MRPAHTLALIRRQASGRCRRRARGFALPLVIGALVLIMVVAARFAQRIDLLRGQAQTMQDYAQARIHATSALSTALWAVSTRSPGPVGFGEGAGLLRADSSPYETSDHATVMLQDQRGLMPLNLPDLRFLRAYLQRSGLAPGEVDQLIDGLLDYTDTDDYHRLNGAEAPETSAAGLPAPRNDWLLNTQELGQVMAWRGRADLVEQLQPLVSLQRDPVFNPLTAPMQLLKVWFGDTAAAQLELFDTLRRAPVAPTAAAVQSLTGLPMVHHEIGFYVGDDISITVWAPGLPRARQYNVGLLPAGDRAPWMVLQARARAGTERRDDQPPTTAFPLSAGALQP